MAVGDYYDHSTYPSNGSFGSSSSMRAELLKIETGISAKLPDLPGNGGKIVAVNSGATALEAVTTTGTGNAVRATSPTMTNACLRTNIFSEQAGITTKSAAATLTMSELLSRLIQYNGAANANLTTPTAADIEAGMTVTAYSNIAFDFSVLVNGAGNAVLVANTNVTITGNATVTSGTSGIFRARRFSSSDWRIYRIA